MNAKAMGQAASHEWETPGALFAQLREEFGPFDLDAAATRHNSKGTLFYSREKSGLTRTWVGRVWLNPPYGRHLPLFLAKALEELGKGNAELVVCLIPARTDTAWWHDLVIPHAKLIRFLRGRVGFVRADGKRSVAPFPSAVVVFGATT